MQSVTRSGVWSLWVLLLLAGCGAEGDGGGACLEGQDGFVGDCGAVDLVDEQAGGQSFGAWNLGYQLPEGWSLSQRQGAALHQLLPTGSDPNTAERAMLVLASIYTQPQQVQQGLASLGLEGLRQEVSQETSRAGLPAWEQRFSGESQAGPVHLTALTVFTPHDTSLTVLAFGLERHAASLAQDADALAASIRVGPPQPNQAWMRELTGDFLYEDTDYETDGSSSSYRVHREALRLDGAGHFQSSYETVISISTGSDSYEDVDSGQDQGRYLILGEELMMVGETSQRLGSLEVFSNGFKLNGAIYSRQ